MWSNFPRALSVRGRSTRFPRAILPLEGRYYNSSRREGHSRGMTVQGLRGGCRARSPGSTSACFISDPVGAELGAEIGIDNIAREAPTIRTATRCGPNVPEELGAAVDRRPASRHDVDNITDGNRRRWFPSDLFVHLWREGGDRLGAPGPGCPSRRAGDVPQHPNRRSRREARRVPGSGHPERSPSRRVDGGVGRRARARWSPGGDPAQN